RAYRALQDSDDGGFRLGDEPAGLMFVGQDESGVAAEADRWARVWPATRAEVLDPPALRSVEPGLAGDALARHPAAGDPVAPDSATTAFWRAAVRRGAVPELGGEATPAIEGHRAVGVRVDGRLEPAERVVVAAGPWTPQVIDPSGGW